ncbi:hypothetical protein BJX62DRAFT_244902 [Aspergillus germanicus]
MPRNTEDARTIWLQLQKANNTHEPYAKPFSLRTWYINARDPRPWKGKFRFAVPLASLVDKGCSDAQRELFNATIEKLRGCGGMLVDIDYGPFETANELVAPNGQNGASLLVLEHIAAIGADFMAENPSTPDPSLQKVFKQHLSAPAKPWVIFQAQARQAECVWKFQAMSSPLNAEGIDILGLIMIGP